MKRAFLVGAVVLGLAACDAEEEGSIEDPRMSMQAQELEAFDWCLYLGWYGNGVCNPYCPQLDPDCGPPAGTCGGDGPHTCTASQYCDFPAGVCGYADETGECEPRPQVCTTQYDPVCGCDGETYGNECEAHRAGVDVLADGPCERPGTCDGHCGEQSDGCWCDEQCEQYGDCCNDYADLCVPSYCGGFGGVQCPAGEYCDFPPNTYCGAADETGECLPRPQACTTQYDPVCGCDGQTYSNACVAHSAGTDVAAEGPCYPSCGGYCGGEGDGCWCDDLCEQYGDCCQDYAEVCGG